MKAVRLACLLLVLVTGARAHRLDEYLQAARIAVATDRIEVVLDLTPGVAVAEQVLAVIDADRDGQLSDVERGAYAQRILDEVPIRLDEQVVALRLMDATFPALPEIKSGLGVIRIKAGAPVGPLPADRHTLRVTHRHLPAISVYLVNALVPKDRAVELTSQTRDELQKDYRLEFQVRPAPP